LYVITRRDLDPGYQATQSIHAFREFLEKHPIVEALWYETSNYIGLLSVANEEELVKLLNKANEKGIKASFFREPDIDDQITAIVLEPNDLSRRLVSNLPLALK
jgi:hypothetical protein